MIGARVRSDDVLGVLVEIKLNGSCFQCSPASKVERPRKKRRACDWLRRAAGGPTLQTVNLAEARAFFDIISSNRELEA